MFEPKVTAPHLDSTETRREVDQRVGVFEAKRFSAAGLLPEVKLTYRPTVSASPPGSTSVGLKLKANENIVDSDDTYVVLVPRLLPQGWLEPPAKSVSHTASAVS
jgi:hypothetical protein